MSLKYLFSISIEPSISKGKKERFLRCLIKEVWKTVFEKQISDTCPVHSEQPYELTNGTNGGTNS